ncbi:guanine nucleotide exchange protein for ADP-robosylation factor [Coemansia aciculifera]|nr:guanine nucleotide exchange protein for ADP-robosylation factor [Coemansia aciculifera]
MSSSGSDSEGPFACGCLNLRVHTQTTSDKRTSLEDISDVLECQLDSEAIQVELRALVEVKPGSSIDPNINVVRCLLCKQPVLYYKPAHPSSMPSTQQRQLPPAYSPAYLAKEAMDPKTVRESMKMSEYSEPFGVLLQAAFVGSAASSSGVRGNSHIPREIQQKAAEFMQRNEAAKNERVHEFIRAQDQALERIRRRATDECNIIADIVSHVQPQALDNQGGASLRKDSVGSSGLAAMLRGRSHSNVGSLPAPSIGGRMANPFARSGADSSKYNRGTDVDGLFDLDDDVDGGGMLPGGLQGVANSTASPAGFRHVSGGVFGRGFSNRRSSSRQSDEHSDDFERDEPAFGNFDDARIGARLSALNMSSQQEERTGGGNLSQMLSGSMPRQIPAYGSSSLAGAHTLNRREFQQRADEIEMNRRREQMVRGLPKTFVPPHQLMDRIHESGASELLIGSKPRDSHAIGRMSNNDSSDELQVAAAEEVGTPTSEYSDTVEQPERTESPPPPPEVVESAADPENDDISTQLSPQLPLPDSPAENDNNEPVAPLPGLVFIIGAMEKLLGTREGKRREGKAALDKALGVLGPKSQAQRSQEDSWLSRADVDCVIEALDVVCRAALSSSATATLVVALDCVEKLVSFHYFDHISDLPTAASVAQRLRSNRRQAATEPDGDQRLMREAIVEADVLRSSVFTGIADRLVAVVAMCFQGENTADAVQLQIVKALFALISSERLPVRQSSMLTTIRTAYNVFVLARSPSNQTIAQGTLTQMVHLVLSRVPTETDDDDEEEEEDDEDASNLQSPLTSPLPPASSTSNSGGKPAGAVNDGAARDAFLLLRALCKLSMRQIPNDHIADGKSPQLRSRCLALNLIRLALAEHTAVFTTAFVYLRSASSSDSSHKQQLAPSAGGDGVADGDEFGDSEGPDHAISQQIEMAAASRKRENGDLPPLPADAEPSEEELPLTDDAPDTSPSSSSVAVPLVGVIRQYLSLSLSRNLVSSNAMVLDLGLAIFELTMQHVRSYLRREIEVIFREIMLPMLETKSSGSLYQRGRVLQTLGRVLAHPALVVELYLNYDCAEDSRVNVFQRVAEILCKLGGSHVALPPKNSPHHWLASSVAVEGAPSSEAAAVVTAAWRAVQQRPTVFNTPLAVVLQSAGLANGAVITSRPRGGSAEQRRPSRTYSTSSQGTGVASSAAAVGSAAQSSAAALMYSGLQFGAVGDRALPIPLVDEYLVRQWALEALAAMLQSMVVWSDRLAGTGSGLSPSVTAEGVAEASSRGATPVALANGPVGASASGSTLQSEGGAATAVASDDPQELSSIKQRKERFEAGNKLFSLKPKKGIESWKASGFIKSSDPLDVAQFLYTNVSQGIDKLQLGEYLGEGDAYNVAVMHAFVDKMEFADMEFVDALRLFLQSFRLPGESQKIDRFMLKFAERYVMGNPGAGFANADTVYVLAYSTVMLNTDQHSPQVRNRMTKAEFINNNRGINDGKNLDPALLERIYDQIVHNEIKMKDDPLEGKLQSRGDSGAGGPLFVLWGNNTANRIREQHAHASAAMAAKSEQSIRSMVRLRRKHGSGRRRSSTSASPARAGSLATLDTWAMLLDMTDYLHATRPDHIAPMFGAIWAAVLAALSVPMQTSPDPHVVAASLIGFQSGIALSCRFRMPLERATFVTTLRNFTQLQNLAEMKRKHVEAIRALIEVAASRPDVGDGLAESWLDVLQCVSQLERLQLLTQGSESAAAFGRSGGRTSSGSTADSGSMFGFTGLSSAQSNSSGSQSISARAFFRPPASVTVGGVAAASASSSTRSSNTLVPTVSVAELAKLETNSQVLVVLVDRLFTSSVHLSGSGIVDFVGALSRVAWSELTAAFQGDNSNAQHKQGHARRGSAAVSARGQGAAPSRLFSLTKIVEISYYNMGRIRVEWSQIWAILGPLFDRVGAYSDTRAALFALDSLRQLSMKFLEKEELPHFAFQKEFLRPFADILEGYIPETSPTPVGGDGNSPRRRSAVVVVDVMVKDMVLRCVHQIVQAAALHIRSGWKAILNVAQIAARDGNDSIAEMGFLIAKACAEQHGPQMWMLATARVQPIDGHQRGSNSGSGDQEVAAVEVVSVAGIEYFHELIDCLNEFAVGAATRRPRFALGAIDTLYVASVALGKQVLAHPSYAKAENISLDDQPLYRVWMPVLRALHEVVMHTEDLEVRTRALDSFFRLVMAHGQHFSRGLWASVLRDLVFAMFADLRDPSASRRFATVDDLELWFSTTLIKALRHLISLFSRYYPTHLSNAMMSEVLELLVMCIAQPSEILGKIGTSCLQDLIRSNHSKWDDEAWGLVCETLARLFNWSQPRELFTIAGASWEAEQRVTASTNGSPPVSDSGSAVLPPISPAVRKTPNTQAHAANRPSPLRTGGSAASLLSSTDGNDTPSPSTAPSTPVVESIGSVMPINVSAKPLPRAGSTVSASADGKPDYLHITLKCILQLLLIQTLGELFGANVEGSGPVAAVESQAAGDDLYCHLSAHHLFILLDCLDQSRAFAHRFNMNRKVRRRLVEMGVMPTMPSLLKQETGSVLVELHILQRMHLDAMGVAYTMKRKQDCVPPAVIAERETVADEVDDRLAMLMRTVFVQYGSASSSRVDSSGVSEDNSDVVDHKYKRSVQLVSAKTTSDLSSAEAKRSLVVTSSWHGSLIATLGHISELSKSKDAAKPFKAAVSRHWPELVDTLGVAASVRDFDVVGGVQRVLAIAGAELKLSASKYTIEE